MSARFRIRTPQGQELSFGSEEMFADFVRSGDLSEGALVYDADTGEWSPAQTHSLVLGLREESEAGTGGEAGGTPGGATASPVAGALNLQLAPQQTPEEAAAAFVERLEEERASDFERIEELRGLKSDAKVDQAFGDIERTPPAPPPPQVSPSGGEPPRVRPRRKPPTRGSTTATAPQQRTVDRRGSRGFLTWALLLGGAAAAVVLGPEIVARAMGSVESDDDGPTVTELSVVPDTEEGLVTFADVRFLGRVRGELASLPSIPREWLDGRYLASASGYPHVRDTWEAHLAAVRRLRVDEGDHYSAAYLSALDDARVTGPTRTLRLASAMSRFERAAPARQRHYERVEALAVAAIDFHDLLVRREAQISYEPAVGTRISADPVLQAASPDPVVQREMESGLDRVLAALSAQGAGPVEAARVPEWTFEGLRAVVAPQ